MATSVANFRCPITPQTISTDMHTKLYDFVCLIFCIKGLTAQEINMFSINARRMTFGQSCIYIYIYIYILPVKLKGSNSSAILKNISIYADGVIVII